MTREDGRQAQENPHVARTRSPTGEELDDVEKVIEQAGCSKTYYELEVCLGENERDWRKCQKEVTAFRLCHEKSKAKQSKNRAGMIEEIKTEFREAKGLSSHAEIEKKVEVARSGVQQMQLYCKLDSKGTDWKVSLDGGGANSSLEK
ncbi:hypothetical protein HOP50_03g26130 [Chloropicon primus]|nr:hypothetical protein HOP50_03g26130 [Chloropicon primus]